MVKVDTVVFAPEQTKQLISGKIPQSAENDNNLASENGSKEIHIATPRAIFTCYFCLCFPVNPTTLQRAVFYFFIFVSIIVSFTYIIPFVCYMKYDNKIEGRYLCYLDTSDQYKHESRSVIQRPLQLSPQCKAISRRDRFDCLPHAIVTLQECDQRNCCYSRIRNGSMLTPYCFYPSGYRSYEYINISATDMGAAAYLKIVSNSQFPNNVPIVKIDFNYRTEDIVEIKIYDPTKARYEPPFPELPTMGSSAAKNTKYVVDIDKDKFGFRIVRKSTNQTIFDTQDTGELIFSDQMLQLNARLPSEYVFGLGQQSSSLMLYLNWTKITMFNYGGPPKKGNNLYGSHPFYMVMEEGDLGNCDGVLLLNSNAMEIMLTPSPGISYRTSGGVLDFFIFLGPTPTDVVRQYTQLVGRPFLPPYWSLGYHQSRFGYNTLNGTMEVWNRTRAAGIPFDTQWNDLDYMKDRNDFTYDEDRFKGLPEFVELLHQEGMHYMVMVDPGVSAGELPGVYPPYDEGIAQNVFVLDDSGYRPFVGKVWNRNSTVWVDFFNPAAVPYWIEQLRRMHNMFPFDGACINMNDPTNFLNGTGAGCSNNTFDEPPYCPKVAGGKLYYHTLCMSAKHHDGVPHYNVHNVYALAEAIVTSFAMQQIREKRPFVISRSSFPGLGRYAGVWTGDIESTFDDMIQSINDVLSFSMFGIPMSGADICGFNGLPLEELCIRWLQLGAFYPFSRSHSSDQSHDKDPVSMGPKVVEVARRSLLTRYTLLPYLYTLFWHAHDGGDTVARPMFFEFNGDLKTYALKYQFMWGPALIIAPVLEVCESSVEAYLPAGLWYDYYSGEMMYSGGANRSLPAPLMGNTPLLLRGGYIIPTQRPDLTTTHSRSNPVDLLVALDTKGQASGDLYWDDGDSMNHVDGIYNFMKFEVANKKFQSKVEQWRYNKASLVLGDVKVMGVNETVHEVAVGGESAVFEYLADVKVLHVKQLYLELRKGIELSWK